ncbi:MAG: AraC family transcriptional regulator ligand-binding domain-containing protein [Polyangiales bacterium]
METPETGGTLATATFRGIAHALAELGIDAPPIFAAAGLGPALLADDRARVPITLEHRIWAEIERSTENPAIGLAVGECFARRGRHTVEIYLALCSETPRGALRMAGRFARLGDDRAHLEVHEHDALATIRAYRDGGLPRAPGFLDALITSIFTMLRDRVPGFQVRGVRLRRPRPQRVDPYLATFGVVPEFDAGVNELCLDRALLDVPLQGSDAVLAEILTKQAIQMLRESPRLSPLVAAVQRVLSEGLARRQVSLSGVARALGTSARTLRRHLTQLGTSFQALLEGVRRDLAGFHLREGDDSVERIAERLGFASTSAFQRAFVRWHGVPPSRFRAESRSQRTGVPPV